MTVTDRGYLDSRQNAVIKSQVESTTTIISIVEEGTYVKEGDIVCVLDSSELESKLQAQEIAVTKAEAALATATENLAIQKTENESAIAAAKLNWELAKLDLEKYKDGEFDQELNQINGTIELKKEELLRNKESFEFTKRMAKKGYRSQSDLEAERLAVTKSEIELRAEEEKRDVLKNYTYKRNIAEYSANAKEFELELDRIQRKANAAINKAQSDKDSAELTLNLEKEQLADLKEQIAFCTLRATQDGEVVYANLQSGRRGNDGVQIEEGATVRERQAIINLPDTTKMKVDARIHESMINKLEVGRPAFVKTEAFPNKTFNGFIASVSSVPMSGSWPNYDIKEYQVEIHLSDDDKDVSDLRPGLTAEFEILVSNREDVLQVPVQSIINLGTKYFIYVIDGEKPERRTVKIGPSNETSIEILDGVAEGELVVMNPRTVFSDELNELEASLEVESANEQSETARSISKRTQTSTARETQAGSKPETANQNKRPNFGTLDKNGDGSLEADEVQGPLKARFDEVDADSDGKISKPEFAKAMAKMRARAEGEARSQ